MIETERLILRYWTEDDVYDMFEYASNPKIGPMAGWKPHDTIEDSKEIVKLFIKNKEYAIVLKENNKVIGSTGAKVSDEKTCEIGYVLDEKYWGRGLMPEACRGFLDELFEKRGFETVYVCHFDFNLQSKRVIEKVGFEYVNETLQQRGFDGVIFAKLNYKMAKETWQSLKNPL